MVWFQCEDCGDNLKKPKLPNHFNFCSASKLSCIDCGQVFSQEDVDSHTQCITEAEKYGPKGHGKVSNSMNAKGKANSKQKPDVDIYVGLSNRPPWVCSLCNTNTTSKQTLLAHADGKKHRAKAKAFHAANQQQCKKDETNDNAENETKQDTSKDKDNKKRKLEASENDAGLLKDSIDVSTEVENGKAAKVNGDVATGLKKAKLGEERENTKLDCTKGNNEVGSKKLKWKKLISSALKSNPEGVLKFSKLTKLVLKSLEGSDYAENKTLVSEILERKISSSSRFILDAKYVRLASSASG